MNAGGAGVLGCDQADEAPVPRGQSVVGRSGAEADVARVGDPAGESQQVRLAKRVGPLVGRDEQIAAPAGPCQPAILCAEGTG
jgi:hypothetical protein